MWITSVTDRWTDQEQNYDSSTVNLTMRIKCCPVLNSEISDKCINLLK